jgi:predicted TIM-barrel fold metal-dependent hydrolase
MSNRAPSIPLFDADNRLYENRDALTKHLPDRITRNICISPFREEDLGALAELIGVDHVLFGSDYPHPEGLADPATYVDELAGLDDEAVRSIMGGNLARLMNVADLAVR